MNIGIAVLCRYESRRLPGKILKQIEGRAVLDRIVERARSADPAAPLVVATSDDPSDRPIADHCAQAGLDCFRGPLDDVAARFLGCAQAHGWDYIVRINGDNLFLDPESLRAMLAIARSGEYDLVTNVPGRTFPYGMSVEIVRTSFFEAVMAGVTDARYREHVTLWLYDNPTAGRRYVFENTVCPEAAGLQLALDTPEDLDRAGRIMQRAGEALAGMGLKDIYRLALETSTEGG